MEIKQLAVYESVIVKDFEEAYASIVANGSNNSLDETIKTTLMLSVCKFYMQYTDKEATKANLANTIVNMCIYTNVLLKKPLGLLLEQALDTEIGNFKIIKVVRLATFLCDSDKEYVIEESTFINLLAMLLYVVINNNMTLKNCFEHIKVDLRLF